MNAKERKAEIARLRALIDSGQRFTPSELSQLRGRIGGLSGKGSPGRAEGGRIGSSRRWAAARAIKALQNQDPS